MILTIFETNLGRNEQTWIHLMLRIIFAGLMAWNISWDVRIKGRLCFEKYTVWGEVSTLAAFLLLIVCSIAKM